MRRPLLLPLLVPALALAASAQTSTRPAAGWRAFPVTTPSAPTSQFAALVGGSDNCATPDVVVGTGLFAFDNTLATTGVEGQADVLCNLTGAGTTILQDVWFTWIATATGGARVNTCGFTTVDTKIAIYAGAGCPAAAAIACNDDACTNFQSTVSWSAVAGQSYTIQLGLYPGTAPVAVGGTGQFELLLFTTPPNDSCATPTSIAGLGSFAFDNVAATTGAQGQVEALCNLTGAGTAILQDVWYSWTSPITGSVRVSSCTTTVDTKIAAYSGSACPGASALACNDDACGPTGFQSSLLLPVTAGSAYTIQLGLYPGTLPIATGGTGSFEIVDASPPANDACATASVIAGAGPHPYDSTFATTSAEGQSESICTFFGSTAVPNDQWYVWTPSVSGTATVSTCVGTGVGASEDTKIAVYLGAGCPTGAALACNDDDGTCGAFGFPSTVTWTITCGQPYTIQVGRYPFNTQPTYGTFDIVETGASCTSGTAFCFGDGSGTLCPCGNNGAFGNGCANSVNANGGNLGGTGTPSISSDTVVLSGSGMPNSSCLYFQGTSQLNAGAGAVFGDGKRCAGGSIVRLGTKSNVAGASQYPVGADPLVSVRGLVTSPGSRTYQAWYRNAAAFCSVSTFNLTNGIQIAWGP